MKKKQWKKRALHAEHDVSALLTDPLIRLTIRVGGRQQWTGAVDHDDLAGGAVTVMFKPDHVQAEAAVAHESWGAALAPAAVSGWAGLDPERPYPGLICPRDPEWASRGMAVLDLTPPVDLT
jgi:hypothetical protein